MKIELTADETRELWENQGSDKYKQIELEDWVDDGKYSYCSAIYQDTESGKHYCLSVDRSGSYFTDYTYSYEYSGNALVEVVQEQIMKTIWKAI